MKIPKLFKKAAAFVMAAVTALSIMPATAFAAGDIGTISFSHTYDSKGNAMRYNSSANIGDYTAGGTGNYKYRMFVDSCQWLSASDFQSAPWLWICGILLYVTITVLSASMITSSVLERTSTLTPFTVTVSIS